MNPIRFAVRRPLTTLTLVVVLVGSGVVGLNEMRADTPHSEGAPKKEHAKSEHGKDEHGKSVPEKEQGTLDYLGDRFNQAKAYIVGQFESKDEAEEEKSHEEHHQKLIVTSPVSKDVSITEPFVCQIRSQRHIDVCALEGGYLEEILVKEGQAVKKGDLMFRIVQTLYQARLDAELAEAQLAQLEYNNTKALCEKKIVSPREVALLQAKLSKAQAKAELAKAELNFTNVKAPFDGIVDRLIAREGSLIKEGDDLTTLSDNSTMWVYFNVREARYLEYMADRESHKDEKIELLLADGNKFPYIGKIGAIEAKFNNQTGNIPFRADFPNPKGLLRHGQTGTVLIERKFKDALVIPQRAVFETLAKRYVYVVGEDGVVHQREIGVQTETDDIFVVAKGLSVKDKIVLEGIRQVRDGDKAEYEFSAPDKVLANLKYRAE